jgi:hypothetical protein
VNFGKNRGRTLKDMSRSDPGFIKWILKGDFSKPVKEIAARFLPKDLQPTLGALVGNIPRPEASPAPQPPAKAAPIVSATQAAVPRPAPPIQPGTTLDLFSATEEDPAASPPAPALSEAE